MPCVDQSTSDRLRGSNSWEADQHWKEKYEKLDYEKRAALAALCGVLTILESSGRYEEIIDSLDYQEMGITKAEFIRIWENHKQDDIKRRG